MQREIDISAGLSDLQAALHSLGDSEDVLLVRKGAVKFSKEKWIEILEGPCGLVADRRHFTPKWAAADAVRHLKTERARLKVNARSENDPLRQFELQTINDGDISVEQIAPADWWEISYQPDKAAAYAYSNTRQPLHTDNAWFSDPAEINFFIMQKQAAAGGEQTIYPLSRLIQDISTEQPALFSDLCGIPVTIKKGDNDYFNHTPIISLGKENRVFWNFYRTEKTTPEIEVMCNAFFKYLEGKEQSTSVERVRCESGDCMSFNDLKMLHGRRAFSATAPFDRVFLHSMWRLPK